MLETSPTRPRRNFEMIDKALLKSVTARFEELECLDEGRFGAVYRCRSKFGEQRAIKIFTVCSRNVKEVEHVKMPMLRHDNIIICFDYWNEKTNWDQLWILEMEYCAGGSLEKVIKERSLRKTPHKILSLFYDCVAGLYYIHSHQITHRDIKPSNILLTGMRNGKNVAKISDFGHYVNSGSFIYATGTLAYLAPEMCHGEITTKVDIYGLGITFFEVVDSLNSEPFQQISSHLVSFKKNSSKFPDEFGRGLNKRLIVIMKELLSAMVCLPEERLTTDQLFFDDRLKQFNDLLNNDMTTEEKDQGLSEKGTPSAKSGEKTADVAHSNEHSEQSIGESCQNWNTVLDGGDDITEEKLHGYLKACYEVLKRLVRSWQQPVTESKEKQQIDGAMASYLEKYLSLCRREYSKTTKNSTRVLLLRFMADTLFKVSRYTVDERKKHKLRDEAVLNYKEAERICGLLPPAHPERMCFFLHFSIYHEKNGDNDTAFAILRRELHLAENDREGASKLSFDERKEYYYMLSLFCENLKNSRTKDEEHISQFSSLPVFQKIFRESNACSSSEAIGHLQTNERWTKSLDETRNTISKTSKHEFAASDDDSEGVIRAARDAAAGGDLSSAVQKWHTLLKLRPVLASEHQREYLATEWRYLKKLTSEWKKTERDSDEDKQTMSEMLDHFKKFITNCEQWLLDSKDDSQKVMLHSYSAKVILHMSLFRRYRELAPQLRSIAMNELRQGELNASRMSPVHPERLQFAIARAEFYNRDGRTQDGYDILYSELKQAEKAMSDLSNLAAEQRQKSESFLASITAIIERKALDNTQRDIEAKLKLIQKFSEQASIRYTDSIFNNASSYYVNNSLEDTAPLSNSSVDMPLTAPILQENLQNVSPKRGIVDITKVNALNRASSHSEGPVGQREQNSHIKLISDAKLEDRQKKFKRCFGFWKQALTMDSNLTQPNQEEFLGGSRRRLKQLCGKLKRNASEAAIEKKLLINMAEVATSAIENCGKWIANAHNLEHRIMLHKNAADILYMLSCCCAEENLKFELRSLTIAEFNKGIQICSHLPPYNATRLQFWMQIAEFYWTDGDYKNSVAVLRKELHKAQCDSAEMNWLSSEDRGVVENILQEYTALLLEREPSSSSRRASKETL